MMKRSAQARWAGSLKQGVGRLSTQSGVLADTPYAFSTRFGDEPGTNPEELIAAAHAGCFSMALAFYLEQAAMPAQNIATTAEQGLQVGAAGSSATGITLRVRAAVPGLADAEFQRIATQAKEGCLVSRLLNAPVRLEAELLPPE